MTQAEAKMRILAEWRTWIGHQRVTGFNTTAEALVFFGEIQQNQPHLLSFEGPDDDKWRLVKGWLTDAGLVKD